MIEMLSYVLPLITGVLTGYNLYAVIKKTTKKQNRELAEINKMIKQAESSLTSANKLCMQNRGSAMLCNNMKVKDLENLQRIIKEISDEVENSKKLDESSEKIS